VRRGMKRQKGWASSSTSSVLCFSTSARAVSSSSVLNRCQSLPCSAPPQSAGKCLALLSTHRLHYTKRSFHLNARRRMCNSPSTKGWKKHHILATVQSITAPHQTYKDTRRQFFNLIPDLSQNQETKALTHFERRVFNWTPEQIFNVVADVDKYREFVPCVQIRES